MKNDMPITEEDASRFRRAILRAKLTRLGVVFEADAHEQTLERMLRFVERDNARVAALHEQKHDKEAS